MHSRLRRTASEVDRKSGRFDLLRGQVKKLYQGGGMACCVKDHRAFKGQV